MNSLCTLRCLCFCTLLWPGGFTVLSAFAADPGPAAEELASRRSLVASALQGAVLGVEAGGSKSAVIRSI